MERTKFRTPEISLENDIYNEIVSFIGEYEEVRDSVSNSDYQAMVEARAKSIINLIRGR